MCSKCSKKSTQMSVQSKQLVSIHKKLTQTNHQNKKTISVASMKIIPSNIKKKIIISSMVVVGTVNNRMCCCDVNFGVNSFCGFCGLQRYYHRKGGHLRRGGMANMGM